MAIFKPKDADRPEVIKEVTFDDISFFQGVINDEYILVIGSGVILNRKKYPETNGDINVHLLNEINEAKGKTFKSLSEAVLAHPLEVSPLHKAIFSLKYEDDDVSPELKELLKSKFFKFVFTTTPDHHVEKVMKAIWDNDLRIVNFSSEQSVRNFCDEIKSSNGLYNKPTLFYVFGRAIKKQAYPTKFLETDIDAISYIEKWIKFDGENSLAPFLKKKRIFSIGCNFDDWYHRFFWHILTSNFSREGQIYNDNAVLGHKTGQLEEYLSLNNVCVHSDPWAILQYINHLLSGQNGDTEFIEMIRSKKLGGKVFISYKNNPDHGLAQSIFDKLTDSTSLKIWFDSSDLLGGQPYNIRIPEAIRYSDVFVPILTPAVAKILKDFSLEQLKTLDSDTGLPYVIQEWRWASQVEGITIIPIAFEGYNLNGPEHQYFESLVYGDNKDGHPSSINMGSKDCLNPASIEKLKDSINNALDIYE